MTPPLFGVTGWKNSGKTTLATRLIAELARRGYAVSSIKHAHHAFDVDKRGTDSFRHREAGASEVAIVYGTRWALMHELRGEEEPTLGDIARRMSDADIVIVEGYKRERHPKIECRRRETIKADPLAVHDSTVVAIAADYDADPHGRPLFRLDDAPGIADFVEAYLGLSRPLRDAETLDAEAR